MWPRTERVLRDRGFVRSLPRDERPHRRHPHWVSGDVDGDGKSLLMRLADPSGEFVASDEIAGLLLPRQLQDTGPFYKVYPEGTIANFDGCNVPDPHYLSDNPTDLNRNFPWAWRPPQHQAGAGVHALSAVESRAVVEFTSARPHIFAWINFHTFGGCFIRPSGSQPDSKMDQQDLALYRQLGAWAEELTGYPMVSGYEEFTYEPETPICGDVTAYAYHQRGCVTWACELWDLFRQVGIAKQKRFVDHYTHLSREDLLAIARWDAKYNHGRVMQPWRVFEHPQLGEVEIGGVDPLIGLWNPPPEKLAEISRGQSALLLRTAALAPRLRLSQPQVNGGEVSVMLRNIGYLPTHVLSSAKTLEHAEPLYVSVEAEGCSLRDSAQANFAVGHLDGWGRGLYDGSFALYHPRSRGTCSSRKLRFSVRGSGQLHLRVGSCRVGEVRCSIAVDA